MRRCERIKKSQLDVQGAGEPASPYIIIYHETELPNQETGICCHERTTGIALSPTLPEKKNDRIKKPKKRGGECGKE